jgi:hypothetical protein
MDLDELFQTKRMLSFEAHSFFRRLRNINGNSIGSFGWLKKKEEKVMMCSDQDVGVMEKSFRRTTQKLGNPFAISSCLLTALIASNCCFLSIAEWYCRSR